MCRLTSGSSSISSGVVSSDARLRTSRGMRELARFDPWWIEEPTSPDDVLRGAKLDFAPAPASPNAPLTPPTRLPRATGG